jgi:glycosyltransferase involved in cell wall biosynthesis
VSTENFLKMIDCAPSSQQFARGSTGMQEAVGHPGRPTLKPPLSWHIITCEYPPQSGGVSDYAHLVAGALAAAHDEVHVWCPGYAGKIPQTPGVNVHSVMGKFTLRDLRNTGRLLSAFPKPRRLLVQWVPHGYGYKALNLPFCLWLLYRSARYGDYVDLMVHEPFLDFTSRSWRQSAAAAVHRLMTVILLRAARHVWVSTPTWKTVLQPYAVMRHHTFDWLPLPSNVPVLDDPAAVAAIRNRYSPGGVLIGHFGTFGPSITPMLSAILPRLLANASQASVILIGGGSAAFRSSFIGEHPNLAQRVNAIGHLDARDPSLSFHISACDLLIQPYPDGVTSRRTTAMAALSHGRPVVTTSGALTESFWKSSDALVLAEVEDADAFVSSVLGLLDNPTKRAGLAECARELYRSQFDIERIVCRLRQGA